MRIEESSNMARKIPRNTDNFNYDNVYLRTHDNLQDVLGRIDQNDDEFIGNNDY